MGSGREDPHVIRLRGPWTTDDRRRVKLPADWGSALGELSSATLRRRFNRPGSLDAGEQVILRVESPHRVLGVRLNDAPLELADGRAEITGVLQDSNQLAMDLQRAGVDSGSLLEVQLEITGSSPGGAAGYENRD